MFSSFSTAQDSDKNEASERKKILSELESVAHNDNAPGLDATFVEDFIKVIVDYDNKNARPNKKSHSDRSGEKLGNVSILGQALSHTSKLISCLVPKQNLDGDVLRLFTVWTVTNFRRLNVKHCLEPALRWINCVLQYDVCKVEDIQCIYEPFFHILGLKTVVRTILNS